MAADSDGLVETVLTCEGDLSDPHFPRRFQKLLANLKQLLFKGSTDGINLQKVEPWNSVRVTFTIPKEAAVRLRQLAQQGNATLLQLGILSVQVEGDEIISLRMANRYGGEAQEIVMHTGAAGPSTSSSHSSSSSTSLSLSSPEHSTEASNVIRSIAQSLSQLPGTSGLSSAFKSPNVVAPLDSDPIPLPPTPSLPSSPAHYHGPPFPFASMTHAAHAIHSRETLIPPPPPYPGPSRSLDPKPLNQPPNVALSSPLLVNLLQNDGFAPSSAVTTGKSSTPVKSKPVSKVESVPNSAFFNTKLPESSVHLPNSNMSQGHSASSNSQIHVSNFNPQVQPANPNPTQIHLATNTNSSQILLSNPSSQVHMGNPNSSQIQIANPSTTQIHLANTTSSQIQTPNSFPNSSQTHTSNSNPSPTFLINPNHNPAPLAQTSKSTTSPFLTKQSVVNQALYTRQFHQSVSSQTPTMRTHSQTPNSVANSISHPQPNSIHPQSKSSEPQIRFQSASLINPSPVAKQTSSSVLPPPPPSLLPPSNNIRSDIQSSLERPPQSHQETMVEAKDFTPPPPPPPPPKLPSDVSPMSSVPIPSPPQPSPVVKTETKATRSDHNKTENVKFSETSQPSHLSNKKQPVMLINPLTGDLEPIPSEVEEVESTSHLSLVNSLDDPFFSFPSPLNDPTNSLFSDDDDVTSILNKKSENTDSSESENLRLASTESKNIQQQVNEKIKLRLKLEKSEPVMPVYKSDISFVQGVRKIRPSGTSLSSSSTAVSVNISSVPAITTVSTPEATNPLSTDSGTSVSTNPEEPKVPPLHISLRGRNAAVVVNSKDEKKWKDGFKAAASGVKKANKLTAGSGFKECSNFVKKNLVFVQQFAEENEEEVDDEEESEEDEEDDDEDEEEDEEQDGEDTEEDEDDEENDEEDEDNKRDVEQNIKSRLEPGEIVSPYSTPIRTAYPTAEEVTSILRSMPSDTHHKMSLSFPKEVKKKESIKKQLHQRLVEGPLSLFHKNTKSKTKSSNSLLKNVVKRAKEARMLSAVRHSTDKQRPIGNGMQRKSSSEKETSPTATQTPGPPNRKFKSGLLIQQCSNESNKTIVPLNHNSTDIVKKFVNNVNKLCNVKNKDNSMRSKDNVINSLASYSNVQSTIVNTVTNASTSNSFNKNFTQTNSQNKKLKDFHMLNDKDLVSFNKTGMKSISSLLNNTLEPFTKLENNSVLLPIIHDIELTEKKIKQKMLESEKAQQLQQLQQEQQMMTFSDTDVKNTSTSTNLDSKSENNRNIADSLRQDSFRSSTENNVNQSEPANSQGEDSGIESMDALSEKSPNQSSESPLYKNNERDDKPTPHSINTLHGVKPEKIVRTSYIDTQILHVQSLKRESVDSKIDHKPDSTVHVKKESKELRSEKIEDNKSDMNCQPSKVPNQEFDRLDKDKLLVDLKDVKTENVNSPASEDPQPIRITPALYTYSNSEKVREDTPSPNLIDEEEEEQSGGQTLTTRAKRKRKPDGSVSTSTEHTQSETQKSDLTDDMKQISPMNSKSLLEQLLIEIPNETRVEPRRSMTTRNTRSQNKFCDMSPEVPTSASSTSSASSSRTPHSSPSLPSELPSTCKPSPNNSKPPRVLERGKSKRNNSISVPLSAGLSNVADTYSSDDSNTVRPNKRKCSENAAELIKACMGVEDHFHATGKRQHLEPSGVGTASTATTTISISPPGKPAKKKGTDVDSDSEMSHSDTLAKHKTCDTTVKTPSSNNISSQPALSGDSKCPPSTTASLSPPLSSTSTTPSVTTVLSSTASNSSPLVRTSSRINDSKIGPNNRRSNRQNKAANDNSKRSGSNNNNKSACGLMKNNNCITRGASKATTPSDDSVATVRRKTRSANVHDSELGPGKRRRSSKDSK